MSQIRRLLELAERRNALADRVSFGAPVDRAIADRAAVLLMEDGIPKAALLESFLRAYVGRHPSILALVDDWRRSRSRTRRGASLQRRELDELYAEFGSGMMLSED